MSRIVPATLDFDGIEIGDKISFLFEGQRLAGEVTRVYNTRDRWHVIVGKGTASAKTFEVGLFSDDIKWATTVEVGRGVLSAPWLGDGQ